MKNKGTDLLKKGADLNPSPSLINPSSYAWRPTASFVTLRQRADILATIRNFFAQRKVLEVETAVLGRYTVTAPQIQSIMAEAPLGNDSYFLQTSPEYAMKRLLAAGSGPIYQMGKAFRKLERGSRHNPEFTLLEWYRPGFEPQDLMQEVAELVNTVLPDPRECEYLSYRDAFQNLLDIDPHKCDREQLERLARKRLDVQMNSDDRDDWLNLLLAELIEPTLGRGKLTFLCDYPASQAALAQLTVDAAGVEVAQRFELYVDGIELANGYYELTDKDEQLRRFQQDQQLSAALGYPPLATDTRLLAALEHGLPVCSGVALGVDRLVMLATGVAAIDEVIAFPSEYA